VLLNFENYKHEEDKYLYNVLNLKNYKNKKVLRMFTDYYNYPKRKNRIRLVKKYTKF
jgi:hypothetical protein